MGVKVKLTTELVNGYVDKLEEIARKYGMTREKLVILLNRKEVRELLPEAITQDFMEMLQQGSGKDPRRRKEYYQE